MADGEGRKEAQGVGKPAQAPHITQKPHPGTWKSQFRMILMALSCYGVYNPQQLKDLAHFRETKPKHLIYGTQYLVCTRSPMKEVSCFVTSDCVPLVRQKILEKGTVSILTLHARAEVSHMTS